MDSLTEHSESSTVVDPPSWVIPLVLAVVSGILAVRIREVLLRARSLGADDTILFFLKLYVGIGTVFVIGILVFELCQLLDDRLRSRISHAVQLWILTLLVIIGVAIPTLIRTVGRLNTSPERMILDSPLQLEIAAHMLVEGRNPYTENYLGTDLQVWWSGATDSPPLYHVVYPPMAFLVVIPFQEACIALFGVFDYRFVLLPAYLLAYGLALRWLRTSPWGIPALGVMFLNPWILPHIERGRLECLIFLFIVSLTQALWRRNAVWTGIMTGLLVTTKTLFLPLIPFVVVYMARINGWEWQESGLSKLLITASRCWIPLFVVVMVVTLPFLIWDASAFLDDTIFSLAGLSEYSYPIIDSGYWNTAGLVRHFGWIKHSGDYFPFWILQLPSGILFLWLGLRKVYYSPSPGWVMGGFTMVTLVYLYFSRFSDAVYMTSIISYALFAAPRRST